MSPRRTRGAATSEFSAADWRDIYDALMDAANLHHSGPRADRIIVLARKIREERLP
jgi:hypothetical protein